MSDTPIIIAPTSWEDSANRWITHVWDNFSTTTYSLETVSLADIRQHIDNMIDTHFTDASNISEQDWVRMIELTLVFIPELTGYVMWRTLCSKQNDYGSNNILKFGHRGLIMRVHDKVARLENLLNNNRDARNESVADTYMDIIGYSVIGLMLLDGSFTLPLGDSWR